MDCSTPGIPVHHQLLELGVLISEHLIFFIHKTFVVGILTWTSIILFVPDLLFLCLWIHSSLYWALWTEHSVQEVACLQGGQLSALSLEEAGMLTDPLELAQSTLWDGERDAVLTPVTQMWRAMQEMAMLSHNPGLAHNQVDEKLYDSSFNNFQIIHAIWK